MTTLDRFEQLCDRLYPLFSRRAFITVTVPLIVIWRLLASSPADPDLFARVAMGRLTLANNAVPLVDPFAFTRTLPAWIDHEWLSGVVFYLTAIAFGDAGLILLKLALASLATLCLLHASTRYQSVMPSRFVWTTLCILHGISAYASTIRCQAFTYLFISILYWAVIEYRVHKYAFLLALTPLMAIAWVNLHGGYALGCCIMGLLVLHQIYTRQLTLGLILIAAAWAAVPIVTPYGFLTFVKVLTHALYMDRPTITEWAPLYTDGYAFALAVILSAPLIGGLLIHKGRHDLFGVGALIFSSYCAFRHIRFLPFFMITAAIFGAPYIHSLCEKLRAIREDRYNRIVRAGAFSFIALLTFGTIQLVGRIFSQSSYHLTYSHAIIYPVAAVEWLRLQEKGGNLLVDFNVGSFALWRLYPRFRVSLDGRYEATYSEETLRDTALAFRPDLAAGAEALKRINPSHILLPVSHEIKDQAATFGSAWSIVYQDPDYFILEKDVRAPPRIGTSQDVDTTSIDMWKALF